MGKRKSKARRVRGSSRKAGLLTETPIAEGVISKRVEATVLDTQAIEVGTKVKIARVINTPVGHRLRIAHTIRWISRDQIDVDYSADVVVDYTKHLSSNGDAVNTAESKGNLVIASSNTVKGFKAGVGRATTKVRRPRKAGRIERYNGMDKKQLKALIEGLTSGEKVSVTFLGDLAERTGDYEVVETKTGRGKGGSKLVTLKAADGTLVTTGTPQSDKILHIVTADGTLHGFETAIDIPRSFETNAGAHDALKAQMKELVGTTGARVRLADSAGEFNGEYTVTQAEQLRGRYGQVKFTLMGENDTIQTLWSYRHSGIVTSFEVLSVPTQSTLATDTTTEA